MIRVTLPVFILGPDQTWEHVRMLTLPMMATTCRSKRVFLYIAGSLN